MCCQAWTPIISEHDCDIDRMVFSVPFAAFCVYAESAIIVPGSNLYGPDVLIALMLVNIDVGEYL